MSKTKEQLIDQGQKMLATIQDIRRLARERDKLMATLEMHARLYCQSIDPHDVERWGWDEGKDYRWPVQTDGKWAGRKLPEAALPGCSVKTWRHNNPVYNYVILKDGTRVDIEPIAQPPKED